MRPDGYIIIDEAEEIMGGDDEMASLGNVGIGSALASGLGNYLNTTAVTSTATVGQMYLTDSTDSTDAMRYYWNLRYQPQQVAKAVFTGFDPAYSISEPEPANILEKLRRETNRFCKDALVMA